MLRVLGAVGSLALCTLAGAVTGFGCGGIYQAFVPGDLGFAMGCVFNGAGIGGLSAGVLGSVALARFGKRLRLARVSAAAIVLGGAVAGATFAFERLHGW